mgnify:CR=1 FL=1
MQQVIGKPYKDELKERIRIVRLYGKPSMHDHSYQRLVLVPGIESDMVRGTSTYYERRGYWSLYDSLYMAMIIEVEKYV